MAEIEPRGLSCHPAKNEWSCFYPLRCEIAAVFGRSALVNVLSEALPPASDPSAPPSPRHVMRWVRGGPLWRNIREGA